MEAGLSIDKATELMEEYNKEDFHRLHAHTLEKLMKEFSEELGYGEEKEYWGIVGLLHDVDFELYPNEHCVKCIDILKDNGGSSDLIHSVCSHGYGLCSDVEPIHMMEKVLFAIDELSGLIWAAKKMRPSNSCKDMELSSLKKKYKDKKFAAGCSRDVIAKGAEMLGWELDELLNRTLENMKKIEDLL